MTNQEKQADEILALQSIFDTKFRLLHDNTQYEISIDFDLVQPFHLRYNDKTSIIHHLPSFSLVIHYHNEYPSDSPPSFLLSCFYFSKSSLQRLCQQLDDCSFVKDEVCVFDWIELIRQQITNELILDTTNNDEQNHEPRALNGYLTENTDEIYQSLISYNNEQEDKQFQNHLQTCLICANIISGTDCIRLYPCGHFYCQTCLNNYVRMAIKNGRFGERIVCPQTECQKALLPNEIKQIIRDDQLYERYERITLQHALESMNDIIWCPRCHSAVLTGNDDDRLAICEQCRFTFCKKCKEVFHSEDKCPRDYLIKHIRLQKEKQLETIRKQQKKDRKKSTKQGQKQKAAAEKELAGQHYREVTIDLSEENALLEAVLNAERMEAINSQLCPNCHVRIEKNGGCLHMRCSRCGHGFCWTTAEGYNSPKMISLLYHSSMDQSVESMKEEINKKIDTAKISAEDETVVINNRSFLGSAIVKRVKACPDIACQKLNVKIGDDNLIVCEDCLEQYCFLCGETINGLKHFEKKCNRHT
ncbi:hypothetical protein I4U23_011205 [Adineta vaga]|nr:hypothetical protein I4U23_011205 [Adineta vaga]